MDRTPCICFLVSCLLFAEAAWPQDGTPTAPEPHRRSAAAASVSLANEQKLHVAFRDLYNLNFAGATARFEEVAAAEPQSATARAFLAAALLYEVLAGQGTLQSQLFVTSNDFLEQERDPPAPEIAKRFLAAAEEARLRAEERVKQDPTDADGLFALALSHGNLATWEAGVNGEYLRGFRVGEKSYDAARKLRAAHAELHDIAVILGVRSYVVGSLPALKRFFLMILGTRGNREKGLAYFSEAAEYGDFFADYARILLAVALIREERLDEAAQLLERLHRTYPGNPLFPFELAGLRLEQERFAEAARLYRRLAVAAGGNGRNSAVLRSEEVLLELGRAEDGAGNLEPALEAFGRAADAAEKRDSQKTLVWAWLERGRVLDRLGRREDALADYDRVIELRADKQATRFARRHKRKPYRVDAPN